MTASEDMDPGQALSFWGLHFSPEEEWRYRDHHRAEVRLARTGLFLFLAAGFGLAPFYQQMLLRPTPEILPLLLAIELACVLPLTLAAAAVSFLHAPRELTKAIQSIAVLVALAAVIALRHLALAGTIHYSPVMIGVVMIAVVLFGQFDLYRIVPVVVAVTLAAIVQEFWLQTPDSDPLIYSYSLLMMAIIALFGAYNQDVMSRWSWQTMNRLRSAQEALRKSEQNYRFMAESSPNQVWTAFPDGKLDYVNQQAIRFSGRPPEELKEMWPSMMHPADLPAVLQHWQDCLKESALFQHECRVKRHDGTYRWCLVRAILLTDDAGQPVKWFGTTVDIDDLWKAREAAEAAAQVKAAFMANVSHEIRTPMNAIIGMTSILLDSKQPAEQREWTEIIRHSGEHLLEIINDILDFSKIEAGKITLESQPFSLRECIESVLDLVALDAVQKEVEIGYLMKAGTPEGVRGDVGRLRQVLLNLVSNAVKFTPTGGQVSVEVSAGQDVHSGMIHFAVKDTGIGIPPEQRAQLFQPFMQVDSSTTRTHGGTGLGLSISKHLVELMGGRIWVESGPGTGSIFYFDIAVPPVTLEQEPGTELLVPKLQDHRVLIVDDIEVNRRLLTFYTSGWGMQCKHTANAEEALDWLAHGEQFDIALLDYHMPGMDGLKLANCVREQRSAKELPIVILSSVTLLGLTSDAVTTTLQKPIKPANLLSVIHDVLEGGPRLQRVRETAKALPNDMGANHPLRILIAEDNASNRKVAQLMFRRLGYEPDAVADGQEALDALKRQTYDVVFLDIQMPVMDGLEAARRTRERLPRDQCPRIVGMSAAAAAEDRNAAIRAGMDDYIVKPVTPMAVVEVLESCKRLS